MNIKKFIAMAVAAFGLLANGDMIKPATQELRHIPISVQIITNAVESITSVSSNLTEVATNVSNDLSIVSSNWTASVTAIEEDVGKDMRVWIDPYPDINQAYNANANRYIVFRPSMFGMTDGCYIRSFTILMTKSDYAYQRPSRPAWCELQTTNGTTLATSFSEDCSIPGKLVRFTFPTVARLYAEEEYHLYFQNEELRVEQAYFGVRLNNNSETAFGGPYLANHPNWRVTMTVTWSNGRPWTEAMPVPSNALPLQADETGAAGYSNEFARADHVHPAETTVTVPELAYSLPASAFPVTFKTSDDDIEHSFAEIGGDPATENGELSWEEYTSEGYVVLACRYTFGGRMSHTAIWFDAETWAYYGTEDIYSVRFNGVAPVAGVSPVLTATHPSVSVRGVAVAPVASLATVATSGSYNDLMNKPTIPAAQVNADWTANSGVAQILHKPTLGTAAAKDVGTTADTVAAGDDSRIVNALPKTGMMMQNDSSLASDHAILCGLVLNAVADTNQGFAFTAPYDEYPRFIVKGDKTAILFGDGGHIRSENGGDFTFGGGSNLTDVVRVNNLADSRPLLAGGEYGTTSASAGSSNTFARADHMHPAETKKQDVVYALPPEAYPICFNYLSRDWYISSSGYWSWEEYGESRSGYGATVSLVKSNDSTWELMVNIPDEATVHLADFFQFDDNTVAFATQTVDDISFGGGLGDDTYKPQVGLYPQLEEAMPMRIFVRGEEVLPKEEVDKAANKAADNARNEATNIILNSLYSKAYDLSLNRDIVAALADVVNTLGGICYSVPVQNYWGLYFEAEQTNSTVSFVTKGNSAPVVSLKYSLDQGQTWSNYVNNAEITLGNIGDSVCFAAANGVTNGRFMASSVSNYNQFEMTGRVAAHGDVMSIIYDDQETADAMMLEIRHLQYLFKDCAALTTAPELPAMNITNYCYVGMFQNCTSLVQAPRLKAVPLSYSYNNMFNGCSSLSVIVVDFTEWSTAQDALRTWVTGVSPQGRFVCPTALGTQESIARATNRCPNGWTVINK